MLVLYVVGIPLGLFLFLYTKYSYLEFLQKGAAHTGMNKEEQASMEKKTVLFLSSVCFSL